MILRLECTLEGCDTALRYTRRLSFNSVSRRQRVPSPVFALPIVDDGVPSGLVDRPFEARQEVGLGGAHLQPLPEAVALTAVAAASGRASRL